MNNNLYEDDELEIDLKEIFFEFKRNIWIIIATAVVGAMAAFGVTKLLMTPIYTAENSILVLTKETTLASLADLQMGSQLTNDYMVLITSRPVLEDVIADLDLDTTYKEFKKTISITNPSNTRVLKIAVEHENPETALEIARAVTKTASTYIGDMMEVVPPKTIDAGVVPEQPTSPSTIKNTAIGLLLGVFLSCGILTLRVILDDTIKSEDDIEKYLGLSTLAVVPDRKDFIDRQAKKNKKKNAKA